MKALWGSVIIVIMTIGIFTGTALYVFRLGSASPFEQLIYVATTFLLGSIGIYTFYIVGRQRWLEEPDPQVRQERLDELRRWFLKLVKIYASIWLVLVVMHAGFLLMSK